MEVSLPGVTRCKSHYLGATNEAGNFYRATCRSPHCTACGQWWEKVTTFLGSCVNGIAIIPFIFAGIIAWPQAVLMAVGGSVGGYLCAHYARRVEPHLIRRVVMIVAFSMTIYFFIYG